MRILAVFFKCLFRYNFFRKRFYLLHKRIFKPFGLFRGFSTICRYDEDLRIMVSLDEWIQQHIYFLGIWDEPGINFLKRELEKDDVFIDAGANIGAYSLAASKLVGPHGKVIAFEPAAEVFEKLVFNIQLNKLLNINAERKAVYSKSCKLKLHISKHENMGMSSIFHYKAESGITEDIEAVSLDDFIPDHDKERIKLIKIDVEGAELFALKGMRMILFEIRPIVILELSDDVIKNSPYNSTDVLNFMKSINYIQKSIDLNGCLTDPNTGNNYSNYIFLPL